MERKPGEHDREVWMGLDRFAVGLTDMVSGGVFSGRQRLSNVHPDLLQEVGWVGGTSAEVARYVPPGSIAVSKTRQWREHRRRSVYHQGGGQARRRGDGVRASSTGGGQ